MVVVVLECRMLWNIVVKVGMLGEWMVMMLLILMFCVVSVLVSSLICVMRVL